VVVEVGLTDWVPPPACKVYLVPSLPVTVTWVAFVAVTVKVDALPAAIEAGLAAIATVGAGAMALKLPPHPVNSRSSRRPGGIQEGIR
jgi:hypothetical protein